MRIISLPEDPMPEKHRVFGYVQVIKTTIMDIIKNTTIYLECCIFLIYIYYFGSFLKYFIALDKFFIGEVK